MGRRKGGGHGGGGGGHDGAGGLRWLLTYSDVVTLLLALFVYFYSISVVNGKKAQDFSQAWAKEFGLFSGNEVPIPGGNGVLPYSGTNVTPQRYQEKMREMQLQGATVNQSERGLIISLTDQVLFAPGSADLLPGSDTIITNVAFFLNDVVPDRPIRIEGHTDNGDLSTPQFPSNWELSAARAATIARVLNDQFGVPGERLSIVGFGPFMPCAGTFADQTEAQRAQNRRVEIVVLRERSTVTAP
ncbi:MAG TPA: OmpA family protein [bacterium]|nr:OmpA family protein [bacterium]